MTNGTQAQERLREPVPFPNVESTPESQAPAAPKRGVFKTLARWALASVGWKIVGEAPKEAKYVLIAAPHTSNWDLVLMLLCGVEYGVWPSWVGKHTIFRAPFGTFFRALGGIAIDRRSPQNMVEQMADRFHKSEQMVLAVPPEGTRGLTENWKSGFYFIAHTGNVPICLGYLDFKAKRGGLGPMLHPTGDVKADMDIVRAFYADKYGRYPELQGPIRLAAEAAPKNKLAGD